jgi:CBS domain-containing protein
MDHVLRRLEGMERPVVSPLQPCELAAAEEPEEGYVAVDGLHVLHYANEPDPSAPAPLRSLLAGMCARDLPYDKEIVRVPERSTLRDCLRLMEANRTSCMCAYDTRGALLGVIDLTDCTMMLLQAELAGLGEPVRSCLRTCAFVKPGASLQLTVDFMKRGWSYVCVGEDVPQGCNIISHGAVLRHLWSRGAGGRSEGVARAAEGDGTDETRGGSGAEAQESAAADEVLPTAVRACIGSEVVVSCDADRATARDALQEMQRARIRLMVLTDERGALAGVMSLSDVKWLAATTDVSPEEALALSPREFVRRSRELSGVDRDVADVVRCQPGSSLFAVLGLMVEHDVHHVVEVDPATGRATGVVSSTDLLRQLV